MRAVVVAEQSGIKTLPRLFHVNPLVWYDAPHTWVDPRGYRLSDRIWRTDEETRRKLDRLLADMVNKGYSAVDIARAAEQFLLPGRSLIRTTKPYVPYMGADGRMVDPESLSFDAMRLARSEIARAHGQAAKAAAITNPYVDAVNWNLSLMHPKVDICDDYQRQNPHEVESAPVPVQDSHPHCLCNLSPVVTKSPSAVTAEIRAALENTLAQDVRPYLTPLQEQTLFTLLLGESLAALLRQAGALAAI